jgi:hypothetical protein
MENSNDTIGNRTRKLAACSAVPEPTAPTAAWPRQKQEIVQITDKMFKNILKSSAYCEIGFTELKLGSIVN